MAGERRGPVFMRTATNPRNNKISGLVMIGLAVRPVLSGNVREDHL